MSPAARLGLCAAAVGGAFGGGTVLGGVVGPLDDLTAYSDGQVEASGDHMIESASHPQEQNMQEHGPQSVYSLVAETTTMSGVDGTPLRFRIEAPDGSIVQNFEPRHERELHLISVSHDLATYLHLHPTRNADGTWSVALPALAPGNYRAFADFVVAGGPALTLDADLVVLGAAALMPLPEPAPVAEVDGYVVNLAGAPAGPGPTQLDLTVTRDGVAVPDLAPYLGAMGHLVVIRAGHLSYAHVHPLEAAPGAPPGTVSFMFDAVQPGDYRLFFDFSHGGTVHTAAFTLRVPPAPAQTETEPSTADADPHAGHEGHEMPGSTTPQP